MEPTGNKAINLKTRILLPAALATALVLAAFVAGNYREENDHLTEDLARTLQAAQGYYHKALEDESEKLGAALEIIVRDGRLRSALGKGNRNALLSLALPLFQGLSTQYGVTHFYFHDRQRVNLLRVHQPARHGDVIDRFTLRTAERTGTVAHGIELGPLGTFTLRVVAPVHAGGQPAGLRRTR